MATADRRAWWEGVRFEFDANATSAQRGEILVGIGDPLDLEQAGIALTPKFKGSRFDSVTDFVRHADAAALAHWRDCFGGWHAVRRVVLEDLSLDTCFSLLLFDAVLHADGAAERLAGWCDYVTQWERGYTREGRAIGDSIAQLLTALGHSYFEVVDGAAALRVDGDKFAEGAQACISLLADAIEQTARPLKIDIAALPVSPPLLRAQTHIGYERDLYLRALHRGITCQLMLPLAGSGRRLLVDALFLEEQTPSALLKVFAREDRETGATKRGFEVLGLYRPALRGTGNDMVISVSKESGLTLQALWQHLERLEDERWGDRRPRDRPRPIRSYRGVEQPPNQPWWDDSGHQTLIAAPKSLAADGGEPYGSRLDWYADVLPAVWSCYCPIPQAMEVGLVSAKHGKSLHCCRWPAGAASKDASAALVESPTFGAWLKAVSSARARPSSMRDLPAAGSFETIAFGGGFAVIDAEGVTVFDDWTPLAPPLERIREIFDETVDHWASLTDYLQQHGHELKEWLLYHQLLLSDPKRFSRRKFIQRKEESWAARSQALLSAAPPTDRIDAWPLGHFRSRLGDVLGLAEHRRAMLEALDRVDGISNEIGEHLRERNSRVFHAIAAGLGLGFAAKEVMELVQRHFVANPYELVSHVLGDRNSAAWVHAQAEALHAWELGTLVTAVAFAAAGFLLFWVYGERISKD